MENNKVRYSFELLGPTLLSWYSERGLTKFGEIEQDGEIYKIEFPTERVAIGKVIVNDPGSDHSTEYTLPPMHKDNWYHFTEWLQTLETEKALSVEELVFLHDTTRPYPIRWLTEDAPKESENIWLVKTHNE